MLCFFTRYLIESGELNRLGATMCMHRPRVAVRSCERLRRRYRAVQLACAKTKILGTLRPGEVPPSTPKRPRLHTAKVANLRLRSSKDACPRRA